ncbi:hypothetical protein JYU16_01275 [bacterium AH-315-M05]|nr:hypothetical protein [bacterium AH-315-M05]
MKKYLVILLFIPFVCACNSGESEIAKLKEEQQKLIDASDKKDSIIIAIVQSFNEIEDNLAVIKEKENIISLSAKDATEFEKNRRTKIIEDIQIINALMIENKQKIASMSKKIASLNKGLKSAGLKMVEFEKMIARLTKSIEEKDMEISTLKDELVNLNISLDSLSVVYAEQTEIIEEQVEALNTAYYCYGTFKELKAQGVVTKEGGFIGIGRTKKLTDDFNKKYFTQIDITETTSIDIFSKKAKIVTTHPSGSYKLEGVDKIDKLLITNPEEFWSASKYLVVIVE